jgi:hypothetical protein
VLAFLLCLVADFLVFSSNFSMLAHVPDFSSEQNQMDEMIMTAPTKQRIATEKVGDLSKVKSVQANSHAQSSSTTTMEVTIDVAAKLKSKPQKPNDWPWPHVHTVVTRFMQNQANLTHLARARIELFKKVCLPTMKGQATQQFLWIILTDPNLDKAIINEMVDLLKDHPNFYLVGCNRNSAKRDVLNEIGMDEIYAGNRTLYLTAKAARKHVPVVQTTLDADDGLHMDFLRDMQSRATQSLARDKLKWLIFCSTSAMEWRMYPSTTYGSLANLDNGRCITPGLTVARSVGVHEIPRSCVGHHGKLIAAVKRLETSESCGYDKPSEYLVILDAKRSSGGFHMIRARTPTSNGMKNVVVSDEQLSSEASETMARLQILQDDFHIPRDGWKGLNKYLEEHVFDIAKDNLKGQCTPGHSCRVCMIHCWSNAGFIGPRNGAALTHSFYRFSFFFCRIRQRFISKVLWKRMLSVCFRVFPFCGACFFALLASKHFMVMLICKHQNGEGRLKIVRSRREIDPGSDNCVYNRKNQTDPHHCRTRTSSNDQK